MRLILIDNYSGYIFGEFCGSDADLIDAVERDCEFLGFVEAKK